MANKTVKQAPKAPTQSYLLGGGAISVPVAEPGLYVISTPIGNLEDITLRALRILAGATRIACEDTRVTAKLLQRYGIRKPLLSYHEHNQREAGAKILACLEAGEAVALVSDAGTPLLSDPGARLVVDAKAAGFAVTACPGASALLAALASSGLPAEEFHFVGFLPPRHTARLKTLDSLRDQRGTLVFYETAPRLAASLTDMTDVLGNRDAAVCRELTKLHEENVTGTLQELAARYNGISVKGEIVVLVAPAEEKKAEVDIEALLQDAMATLSMKEAVARVAKTSGAPRREVYAAAIRLKDA